MESPLDGWAIAAPVTLTISAAAASTIANDVFIVRSPSILVLKTILELEGDSNSSLKLALWHMPQLQDFISGMD